MKLLWELLYPKEFQTWWENTWRRGWTVEFLDLGDFERLEVQTYELILGAKGLKGLKTFGCSGVDIVLSKHQYHI